MSGGAGHAQRPSVLSTLADRIFGHTSIFAVGSGMILVLAAVRLAVLTRLLEMSVYGQLVLLLVMAGLVTTLCRIVVVTGSLRAAFRAGDDEAGGEEDGEPVVDARAASGQRRILGTGLIGSMLVTTMVVAGVAVFAAPIDDMLIGSGAWFPVVAAALLGGLDGSFWLCSHLARFERRPVTYVALNVSHAALGLVAAITLIEAGYGLEGAIGGLALGSALAMIPGWWVSRHRFSFTPDIDHLKLLAKLGWPLAGMILGRFVFQYADVFMVSRYLPEDDVALYRVAGRIGGVVAGLASGVLLAWGPLMRGPLRGALHREGLLLSAGAGLLTYFWLAAVWLIVALVLMRDLLIRVAPPEYGPAAYLIAFLGLAALLTTGLIVAYRTSRLRHRLLIVTAFLVGMSPALIVLSIFLIPRFGLDGAAAASIATPLLSATMFLAISQRFSPSPLELPWARLALATSLAAAYCVAFVLISTWIGDAGIWLSVPAALAFPGVLVLSGVLPREDARAITRLVARLRQRGASRLAEGLAALETGDLEVLDSLLRSRRAPDEVALAADQSEDELLERFVSLLREVGEIGQPRPTDNLIGRYLLSPTNLNLRDRKGHRLALERGVDSMEVDELTALSDRIKQLSEKQWLVLTGRHGGGCETT